MVTKHKEKEFNMILDGTAWKIHIPPTYLECHSEPLAT